MIQLQLTKEHKSKLLEMCLKLFPEYIIKKELVNRTQDAKIEFCHDNEYFWDIVDTILEIPDPNSVKKHPVVKNHTIYSCTYIHWFEFTIYHLAPKVLYENFKQYFDDEEMGSLEEYIHDEEHYEEFLCTTLIFRENKLHPIDYLYEKFKETKS